MCETIPIFRVKIFFDAIHQIFKALKERRGLKLGRDDTLSLPVTIWPVCLVAVASIAAPELSETDQC